MLGDFAVDPAVAGAAHNVVPDREPELSLLLGDHLGCLDACEEPFL